MAAFWIDRTDVTNAQFAAFAQATGYVTVAERLGTSLVFVGASAVVDMNDPGRWWRVVRGASWRQPMGPGSTIAGRETLPVVHVAYEDAQAYAHRPTRAGSAPTGRPRPNGNTRRAAASTARG